MRRENDGANERISRAQPWVVDMHVATLLPACLPAFLPVTPPRYEGCATCRAARAGWQPCRVSPAPVPVPVPVPVLVPVGALVLARLITMYRLLLAGPAGLAGLAGMMGWPASAVRNPPPGDPSHRAAQVRYMWFAHMDARV